MAVLAGSGVNSLESLDVLDGDVREEIGIGRGDQPQAEGTQVGGAVDAHRFLVGVAGAHADRYVAHVGEVSEEPA